MNIRVKRFTLIELLMVLAIIGILLSILLPSLKRAREMGYKAVCLSNLKQVGMATQLYLKSNNQKLISISRPDYADWNGWRGWTMSLANSGYIDIDEQQIYNCPKAVKNPESNARWYSYGINSNLTTNNIDHPDNSWASGIIEGWHYEWLMPQRIQTPSDTMFFVDSRSGQQHHTFRQKSYVTNMTAAWIGRIWTIHRPGVNGNALFIDGHASAELKSNFMKKFGGNLDFSNTGLD